jgi:nicotinamide-nucleotide amidase
MDLAGVKGKNYFCGPIMSTALPTASIITIGDELLIGQTIDTNSAFIAQELNQIGMWVRRRVAVGDRYDDIWQALDQEAQTSDLVLITGGLGPTSDDITKPLLCEYFGGKLIRDQSVLQHIEYLFKEVYRRPGPLLDRNIRQADVPDVCEVLPNAIGTAPGMLFRKNGKVFISLPGVPAEMKRLITEQVIPRVVREWKMASILHRTLLTAGAGESILAEALIGFESTLSKSLKLAYLPKFGMVKLRLTYIGASESEGNALIEEAFPRLAAAVNTWLVTEEDINLEVLIGNWLRKHKKTLGTAESCTGGSIAQLLTSVPGSSEYFIGSVVSYANRIKVELLDVQQETLVTVGAVSQKAVTEMIHGGLKRLGTDFMVSVSGILGPGGATPEKPVGTVWIAAGSRQRIITRQLNLRFDRSRNTVITTHQCLLLLWELLQTNEG